MSLKSSLYSSLDRLRINSIITLFYNKPRDEIKSLLELKDFFHKNEKVNGRIKYCGLSLAKDFHYSSNEVNYFDALQNDLNIVHTSHFIRKYKQRLWFIMHVHHLRLDYYQVG